MRTLYLECNMGAAGDMLMAALLELSGDRAGFVSRLNALGLPQVRARAERVERDGIVGTGVRITVGGAEEESHDAHHHREGEHTHGMAEYHHHEVEYTHGAESHHHHEGEHAHGAEGHHHHEGEHAHGTEHHHHEGEHAHGAEGHHHHEGEHTHGVEHHHHEGEHTHGAEHHHHEGEHTHGADSHHHHEGEHVHGAEGHHHSGLSDIEGIINGLELSARVKEDALAVYRIIAEAEAHVHGRKVELVHFHEVGALDAVADIVGVCMLMEELAPDAVYASAVNVGGGSVRCAHGILPVPAPATARILSGVKSYGSDINAELCTPTGAALLKYFARGFGSRAEMSVEAIGYGMGKKPLPANFVRAFLGEAQCGANEEVAELCCQMDDMTGEAMGFAQEMLAEAGALDVFVTAVQMKKNRPGFLLTCVCRQEDTERFVRLILMHTTTLGVRVCRQGRYSLAREFYTVKTEYGEVRFKRACGYGVEKSKPEYEDVRALAKERGVSAGEVWRACAAADGGAEQ